jgi:membrane protein DedA with SNARE-associated domain
VGGLLDLASRVLEQLGYAGLALLMALETIFPPIPSEVVLPVAGVLVAQGRMGFLPALLAATLGAVAGALVLYALARRIGERRVRAWVAAHGRWVLLRPNDLDKGQAWFRRHGDSAVVLARLIPGARSLVSIPAGLAGMSLPRFALLTALGSLAWNAALLGAGVALDHAVERIQGASLAVEVGIGLVALALVVRFAWGRLRHPPREQRSEA